MGKIDVTFRKYLTAMVAKDVMQKKALLLHLADKRVSDMFEAMNIMFQDLDNVYDKIMFQDLDNVYDRIKDAPTAHFDSKKRTI